MIDHFFKALFHHAYATGERSTILKTLFNFGVVLAITIIAFLKYHAPMWLIVAFTSIFFLLFVTIIISHLYCIKNNPDLLRSEKFLIQKMSIEKGYVGDNIKGIIDKDNMQDEQKDQMISITYTKRGQSE